ncbi:MAG: hypothetical protein ACUVSQ_08755 [Pseudanabaenaceae cyanobacterium]
MKAMTSCCLLGLAVLGWAPTAIAQTAPTEAQQALEELQQKNRDFSTSQGSTSLMQQLIHNANFSDSRSADRISREQDEALEKAVARFRQQQREQLPPPAIARPQANSQAN